MYNVGANGYNSQAQGIFATDNIVQRILQTYHESALMPRIAKSNFLKPEELFCGGQAVYGVADNLDIFGQDTDNNEAPELLDGPNVRLDSMRVCQQQKFEIKISNADKARMCNGDFELWESILKRQIELGIRRLIDAYSVPKIIASASPDNVGMAAGKLTHGYKLGDQGSGALTITNEQQFEDTFFDLLEVARESGMTADPSEDIVLGETAKPIILIPNQLSRHALRLLKGLNTCCSEENVMRTGIIGSLYNVDVLPTTNLLPMNMGSAGKINQILLLDPNRILHAFKIITNKWYEGKFEDYLVGEFIFDTKVLDPYAVIVANYKA